MNERHEIITEMKDWKSFSLEYLNFLLELVNEMKDRVANETNPIKYIQMTTKIRLIEGLIDTWHKIYKE